MNEQNIAALLGSGGAAAAELLNWIREKDEYNRSRLKTCDDRITKLEARPLPAPLPPALLAYLPDVSDAALAVDFAITSTAAGAYASTNVAVNATDSTGAGAGATAKLLNADATVSTQKTKAHRIRLTPAGTPGAGLAFTVTFPQALAKVPAVFLQPESNQANAHTFIVGSVSRTGYTVVAKSAPSGSVDYDFSVEVKEY